MSSMKLQLAALISVALFVGYVDLVTAEEDNASLQYIYAFFRHGIRSPLFEPYPNDPNKYEYETYLPGSPGILSKIGKQIMYKVGQNMRSIYKEFLGDFVDENVHVSSTPTSRTIMSALVSMAGMFPPCKPLLDQLDWQPVPVWQDSAEFDKSYLYLGDNFAERALKECPNYGKLIEKGSDFVFNPDTNKDHQKLYKLLRNYTGKSDIHSLMNHWKIWDTLECESLNGLPLPDWSTKPQPEYDNRPLYPDVMKPVMVQLFQGLQHFNRSTDMLRFYSGPLMNSLFAHMTKKVQDPESYEKLRYHSTHDMTLYVLLWALDLTEPAAVELGDGIIFELHNFNNTPIVKVKYYRTLHNHSVTEVQLPLCPKPCELSQLQKSVPGLTPSKWNQKCLE